MLEVLLIEDNPGDVRLLEEAFRELGADIHMQVAKDGAEGLQMIFQASQRKTDRHPDIILLDLNLPKIDGKDVLARLKGDDRLVDIPVIVFSSSMAALDVDQAYRLQANCYVAKPADFDRYVTFMTALKEFWIGFAQLPSPLAVNL